MDAINLAIVLGPCLLYPPVIKIFFKKNLMKKTPSDDPSVYNLSNKIISILIEQYKNIFQQVFYNFVEISNCRFFKRK